MYGDKHTSEYIKGVHNFTEVAEEKKQNGFMCCPWRKYALEAIIKLLFISLFHDKCLLFMLELYYPET